MILALVLVKKAIHILSTHSSMSLMPILSFQITDRFVVRWSSDAIGLMAITAGFESQSCRIFILARLCHLTDVLGNRV